MLDIRAIAFGLLITTMSICFAHLCNWHIHRQFRGPGWWAVGSFFFILGIAFILLRGQVPDAISIVLAQATLVTAQLFYLQGFCAFARHPFPRRLAAYVLLFNCTGNAFFTFAEPSLVGRQLILFLSCLPPLLLQLRIQRQLARDEGGIGVSFIFCITVGILLQPLFLALFILALLGPGEHPILISPILSPFFSAYLGLHFGYASGCILVAANRSRLLLEQTALQDPLTRLPNRRALDTELARILGDGRRHGGARVGLALFDLDHFKRVNDQHGHQVGDLVLQHFAAVALAQCRGGDILSRMGGEEFALLMRDTDRDGVREAAERIRSALEHTPLACPAFAEAGSTIIHTTLSAGVAAAAATATPIAFEALYRRADAALYAAKAAGRNRVEAAADLATDLAADPAHLIATPAIAVHTVLTPPDQVENASTSG
jgi:diguanylate cyclase (GGDEF)-like protein